tara:strand:- start:1456 stop:1818 length:363 start_codon:yes stop_codon:yes gene_type:complete
MLRVEIADTPIMLEKGLMFRTKLSEDRGMLFKFQKPKKLAFWGKNTFIPLDIAFIDKNNIIKEINHISKNSLSPIFSNHDCDMAIEANLGYFSVNKIHPGYKISLHKLSKDSGIISFHRI